MDTRHLVFYIYKVLGFTFLYLPFDEDESKLKYVATVVGKLFYNNKAVSMDMCENQQMHQSFTQFINYVW
jgi:hypothetical protein